MIKKSTKKVVKEVEEVVSEVIICDICNQPLHYVGKARTGRYAVYYTVCTGHYDWGDDSSDSMHEYDVCCNECLAKLSQRWINDKEVQSSNTAYFRVEKETHELKGDLPK